MKNTLLFFFVVLLFTSCSREEETNLEAYNAEAFAFEVDGGWEVNATIRIKGFQQDLQSESYSAKLSYAVGLITSSDTIKNLVSDQISEIQDEEFMDLPVEVQLELDSTYSAGQYKLLFDIKDEISGKTTSAIKELELQ